MKIIFKSVSKKNYPLIEQWLELSHTKKQPDAFIIFSDASPIGYIQYSKVSKPLESTAFINFFVHKENVTNDCTKKDILELFLEQYVFKYFNYAVVEANIDDLAAISCFEQMGFSQYKVIHNTLLMVVSKRRVRLSNLDMITIELTFREVWQPNDTLWIFGSRADLNKKGGDIDIYIETHIDCVEKALEMKQMFTTRLIDRLGEQKIDIVLNILKLSENLPIHQIAKTEGVKIL